MTRWCWWVGLGGWFWVGIGDWRVGWLEGKLLERTSARGFVSILWLEFFMD
ncbi:hypothetical protein [Bartonella sp. AC142YNZD]|uniref:hypothetical protein n=1 Tax=Bartonella sp. AC142YNZD TaxID=3243448 RepID=UPI0035D06D08